MPNQKGGKKFKKGKKQTFTKKEFITKDPKEPEEYAVIKKVLGSKRYELLCQDGITRIGICRGKLRTRILVDDIVLVGLWVDMQEDKCSILHKYDEDDNITEQAYYDIEDLEFFVQYKFFQEKELFENYHQI